MTEQNADELRRVLTQIASMRAHLLPLSDERDAARFHEQLDRLGSAGYDVREFYVPDADMYHQRQSYNTTTGKSNYARERTVRPGVLESKMDAVLAFFQL